MVTILYQSETLHPTWVDVENPTKDELFQVAMQYGLNQEAMLDCLDPEHLPKYEEIDNSIFIIARMYDYTAAPDATSVLELTRKIAIFCTEHTFVTIHRSTMPFLARVRDRYFSHEGKRPLTRFHLLALLLDKVLSSYFELIEKVDEDLDYYESSLFLMEPVPELTKQLYYLKRKASLSRKVVMLSKDILNKIELNAKGPIVQDLKDTYTEVETSFDNIIENSGYLINTHLSFMSQRTNEIMRTLTILSVFFMPLTFIVGIYGMNFRIMPEIEWEYGYIAVWLLMAITTGIIFWFFRRKRWM